jgi:hypothetical protein
MRRLFDRAAGLSPTVRGLLWSAASGALSIDGTAVIIWVPASAVACSGAAAACSTTSAGSSGSASGLDHSTPTTSCRATSHHRPARADADRRGSDLHNAQTTATNKVDCTLAASRRGSRISETNSRAMTQLSLRLD